MKSSKPISIGQVDLPDTQLLSKDIVLEPSDILGYTSPIEVIPGEPGKMIILHSVIALYDSDTGSENYDINGTNLNFRNNGSLSGVSITRPFEASTLGIVRILGRADANITDPTSPVSLELQHVPNTGDREFKIRVYYRLVELI